MFARQLSLAVAAGLFLLQPAMADMGRILVGDQGVKVEETAQKAIILHNRTDEVLILGTEIGASGAASILRFIPFPSEPAASLAAPGAFDRLAEVVTKYRLRFQSRAMTKGGADAGKSDGVAVVSAARLGAHDLTTIKVNDVAAFRAWVRDYAARHGLRVNDSYPAEEAIVADYVKRGLTYFVLDRVELSGETRFVDPIAFRFSSAQLYYPLVTSNSFGGKGAIELFVVAPVTLCRPGSNDPVAYFRGEDHDLAATPPGEPQAKCLGLPVKASTSARLAAEERDLAAIWPGWDAFFGDMPMFLQAIRYAGDYRFSDDVRVAVSGEAKALEAQPSSGRPLPGLEALARPAACDLKPERGPCKAAFEVFYFDGAANACKPAIWGGCQGVAPFETREDCEAKCVVEK
jgi:hypothetical protein